MLRRAIIGILLKIIGGLLTKNEADRKAKEAYLEFVGSLNSVGVAAVKLNTDDQAQFEELEERRRLLLPRGNDENT